MPSPPFANRNEDVIHESGTSGGLPATRQAGGCAGAEDRRSVRRDRPDRRRRGLPDGHSHHAGGLEAAFHPKLPYTLGHENAGWIEEVGGAVSHLKKGDPVVLHPAVTCGFCVACRSGNDMHCPTWKFPGVDGVDGGYADFMRTSARSVVKLASGTDPASLAPQGDAGLTDYHAVKQILPFTYPGSTVVVIGVGGLGHLAIQILHALTPARIVVVATRPERVAFAKSFGADEVV